MACPNAISVVFKSFALLGIWPARWCGAVACPNGICLVNGLPDGAVACPNAIFVAFKRNRRFLNNLSTIL